MANIGRTASAVWSGDLRSGNGQLNSASGVLDSIGYSFATRFENKPGTNPEELIAAAHAACFSMQLAATLGRKGYQPHQVQTSATCIMTPKQPSGFTISKMRLESQVQIEGLDDAEFQQIAREAEAGCIVSNALRGSLEIELNASMM